jgi:RND family efflux transporter MFP subunit
MNALSLRKYCCLLALLVSEWGCGRAEEAAQSETEEKTVEVQAAAAVRRDVEEAISALGRTEAVPENLAIITAAVEGHVHKVCAKPGDVVHEGDNLVEFDPSLANADLAEKLAGQEAAQSALDLLTAPPRDEDRRPLELGVKQAEIALERAKEFAERIKSLAGKKEASDAQLYDAQKVVEQAELQSKTSQAQLDVLLAGPRPQAIDEARAKLKAAIELTTLARTRRDLGTIRAPIAGVVDSLHCHLGQTVSPGATLGELIDSHEVLIVVYLPPLIARKVKVGQNVHVLPPVGHETENVGHETENSDADSSLSGEVQFVSQVTDVQTGSVAIRILVNNAQATLAIGQVVNVKIVVGTEKDAVCVPSSALVDLGDGPTITVVDEGKTKLLRPTSVTTDQEWTVVRGVSMQEGEKVVVSGQFNLPEGTLVSIAEEPSAKHE